MLAAWFFNNWRLASPIWNVPDYMILWITYCTCVIILAAVLVLWPWIVRKLTPLVYRILRARVLADR